MEEETPRKFSFDNKNHKRNGGSAQHYKRNGGGVNTGDTGVQKSYGPVPCTNCGLEGHSNRQCTAPITSYGVIAFRIKNAEWSLRKMLCSDEKNIAGVPIITGYEGCSGFEFLLIRRRDSLRFVEFIRGKYDVNDDVYLRQMVENMTCVERDKLQAYTFDELWNMVWGSASNQGRAYKNDYETSKIKFNKLLAINDCGKTLLQQILDETTSPWKEPEWGFPKGRRNPREDDKTAALREFTEETGISPYDYEIVDNLEPISENFYGDNHVYYCHKYYMAFCGPNVHLHIKDNDEQMVREISEIGWFSLDEALSKIRPENVEKTGDFIESKWIFT